MTLRAEKSYRGYSWTFVSRLGQMLKRAQDAYGNRDTSYTILGIEFYANGPQIWFPDDHTDIAIQLSIEVEDDMEMGCYQLAHECIHLLSPIKGNASTFEEGLATYFAYEYVLDIFEKPILAKQKSYDEARDLVAELLALDSESVKVLRKIEPTISKITATQILSHYPSLRLETAELLAAPFVRGR